MQWLSKQAIDFSRSSCGSLGIRLGDCLARSLPLSGFANHVFDRLLFIRRFEQFRRKRLASYPREGVVDLKRMNCFRARIALAQVTLAIFDFCDWQLAKDKFLQVVSFRTFRFDFGHRTHLTGY